MMNLYQKRLEVNSNLVVNGMDKHNRVDLALVVTEGFNGFFYFVVLGYDSCFIKRLYSYVLLC